MVFIHECDDTIVYPEASGAKLCLSKFETFHLDPHRHQNSLARGDTGIGEWQDVEWCIDTEQGELKEGERVRSRVEEKDECLLKKGGTSITRWLL